MPLLHLVLIVSLILVLSCGENEPVVDVCTISVDDLNCNPLDPEKPLYRLSFIDALGYQAVSPIHYGEIESHHQDLHQKLDECNGKRR